MDAFQCDLLPDLRFHFSAGFQQLCSDSSLILMLFVLKLNFYLLLKELQAAKFIFLHNEQVLRLFLSDFGVLRRRRYLRIRRETPKSVRLFSVRYR